MPLDFRSARNACRNLSDRLPTGALISLPGGRQCHVLRPALHSETLEPCLVVLRAGQPSGLELGICAPGAARVIDIDANLPPQFTGPLEAGVFRHRKGGTYTRVGHAGTRDGEMTVYAAHEDGSWWVRPRVLFDDGRFETSAERPLDRDELGLSG